MSTIRTITCISAVALLLTASRICLATEIAADHPLATVGQQIITAAAFTQQVRQGMRQRFYHGKIPEGELEKFGNEVLQQMIDRSLLLQEARQRKLQPDSEAIDEKIADYDKQYASSERWQKERAERLPLLRANLEQQGLLTALEAEVRKVTAPSDKQVRNYYLQHPDKFTTPEKVHVSLILLKVEPSSPAATWQAALEEGRGIIEKLRQGSDFAALAKLHSEDASAKQGGDLGYIHKGMLAPEAQQAIDALKPNDISEPVRVLQGIAVLRLNNRTAAKLNPFEQVNQRAGELLLRDSADDAWRKLTEQLRQQTKISIDHKTFQALFTPTPPSTIEQRSGEQ